MKQNITSVTDKDGFSLRKTISFFGITVALLSLYAAASAPVPLFRLYQQQIGMTNSDLAIAAVCYFVGTLLTLLFLARISNYLGRKPISIIAIALTIIACVLFIFVDNIPIFFLSRFIQGITAGLAASCLNVYLIDTAPKNSPLAAAITASGPMLGLAIGAFSSSSFVQYGDGDLDFIYITLIIINAICLILIICSAETIKEIKYDKTVFQAFKPRMVLPKKVKPLIPEAAAIIIGTWAIGGFYQAFSAPMAAEELGTSNTVVAAAVFSSIMVSNTVASLATKSWNAKTAQHVGMTLFILAIIGVVICLNLNMTIPFLLTSLIAGACIGITFSGTLRRVLSNTPAKARADVMSIIYIICYCGAAIPNLIVGQIAEMFSLTEIATGYSILTIIAWIIMMMCKKRSTMI